MTQALNNYETMPTREKMKPRGAKHPSAMRSEAGWDTKPRKKKNVDRCEKVSYYLDTED
jgi:hypothetical protein